MAKKDSHRWWDWRVNQVSGESIRDQRGLGEARRAAPQGKKKGGTGGGWWWTLIGREASCDKCKKELQPPEKVAYNHSSKKIYCPECAKAQCVSTMCRPSKKMLDQQRKPVAQTTLPG